jgi:hypothetical protein
MAKLDPKGEVPNPIKAKLAQDIATPIGHRGTVDPIRDSSKDISRLLSSGKKGAAKLTKAKKVLFSVEEQKENDAVVSRIADITGADTLGWSHVDRALWSLLRHAQDQIGRHSKDVPKLSRPSNTNPMEVALFEDQLAAFLLNLFKDSPRNIL